MWSRKHEACIECGTTETRHQGHGLCINCFSRKRRKLKGEEYKKYRREYRKQPHVIKKTKEYDQRPEVKARRREDARRWRERNPERSKEVQRNWRKRHPDRVKEYNERPYVKERSRRRWINKQFGENGFLVLERDNYICKKCDSKKQICIHHIDWDEDNNELDNLVVLCNSCHRKLHLFIPKELCQEIFEIWMK